MIGKDYFTQKKVSVILVVLLLIIGSAVYFFTGAATKTAMGETKVNSNVDLSLFKDITLKTTYTPEGDIKIFALARNNVLAKYPSSDGNNIPESNSVVIGADEAQMMIREKLFTKPGDSLTNFFGINTTVEGVLDSTGTFADDFHFLSSESFAEIKGDSDVLLIKFKDENTPKLFYMYDKDNPSPAKIELIEGNMNLFYKHIVGKKVYYPLIIGEKEAKMMREEKLFSKTGDTLEGFFGKDVMIVGIVKETNTGMDMMHIVEKDFFEKPVTPIVGTVL